MRLISVSCVFLLLCGFAAAQATVIGGTASNWVPAYGIYAAPFVPLVTTPSVTLATVSPSAVGASNATFGNVAGATNATLSSEFVAEPPVGVYTEPVWYGPSAAVSIPSEHREMHRHPQEERAFDFMAAPWESLAGWRNASAGAKKASRTYTNQDIDHVNQSNGNVKYDGKTEHI